MENKEAKKVSKKRPAKEGVKLFCSESKALDYKLPNDDIVTPIQIGNCQESIAELKTKDYHPKMNEMSAFWGDAEAIYWVWKNVKDAKYKGQFSNTFKLPYDRINIEKALSENGAICSFTQFDTGIEDVYNLFHIYECLEDVKQIVLSDYPEYELSWKNFITHSHYLLHGNGFIMKSTEYDKYCKWLFGILNKYIKLKGFKTVSDVEKYVEESGHLDDLDVQVGIGEFLSEWLQTLYFFHNFKEKIYLVDYDEY